MHNSLTHRSQQQENKILKRPFCILYVLNFLSAPKITYNYCLTITIILLINMSGIWEHKKLIRPNVSSVYVSCLCFLLRPKNNFQLPFVKTVLKVIGANMTIVLFSPMFVTWFFCLPMYITRYLCFHENLRKMCIFLLTAGDKFTIKVKYPLKSWRGTILLYSNCKFSFHL